MRHQADISALARALRRTVTGESEEARLAGAAAVLAALQPLLRQSNPKSRRGRRRIHDRDWAMEQLVGLAASIDGLPDEQPAVVKWLSERFEDSGRAVPCDSWLKRVDRQFRGKAAIAEQESRSKYQASTSLQGAFQSETDYLIYCAARGRLERKWLHDKALQARFSSPSDFVASELMRS